MAARHRLLRILFPAGLLALTGCVTPLTRPFEDLPPAQLEPAPPRPITLLLPPAPETGSRRPAAAAGWNDQSPGHAPLACGERVEPAPLPPVTIRPPPAPRPYPAAPPAVLPALSAAGPLTFRRIIALQTLLDRRNFSCNCADGRIGSRTHAALRAWQGAHGLPVTGEADAATQAQLGSLDGLLTAYSVTAADHAALVAIPKTWVGKSQMQRLGYETILAAVAERGHAAQQAIRDLNPGVAVWPDPPAGTVLTIPDPGPAPTAATTPRASRVRISIGQKLVYAYDGTGRLIAQFPCSIARDPRKREPCAISVAALAPNPNYSFDPALFSEDPESASIKTKLIIPPGPCNPVGVAWVGLSKAGYGIHGTPHPEDIGKTESHGCFRLANWNALKLLHMVEIGTPVTVEE
ncbi:MAG: L,D-transpeptidase [Kiritimatiellaeota bacterium]|nr:L,D-transpeptidase [Kiritimatiellota bacterium]